MNRGEFSEYALRLTELILERNSRESMRLLGEMKRQLDDQTVRKAMYAKKDSETRFHRSTIEIMAKILDVKFEEICPGRQYLSRS